MNLGECTFEIRDRDLWLDRKVVTLVALGDGNEVATCPMVVSKAPLGYPTSQNGGGTCEYRYAIIYSVKVAPENPGGIGRSDMDNLAKVMWGKLLEYARSSELETTIHVDPRSSAANVVSALESSVCEGSSHYFNGEFMGKQDVA